MFHDWICVSGLASSCAECGGKYSEVKEEEWYNAPSWLASFVIVSPSVLLTNPLGFVCYAFFSFLRFNERPDMTIVENVCCWVMSG